VQRRHRQSRTNDADVRQLSAGSWRSLVALDSFWTRLWHKQSDLVSDIASDSMAAAGGEQTRSGAVCHSLLTRYHNWTLVGPKMDSHSRLRSARVSAQARGPSEAPCPSTVRFGPPVLVFVRGWFRGLDDGGGENLSPLKGVWRRAPPPRATMLPGLNLALEDDRGSIG
jgi:hypothetical protein